MTKHPKHLMAHVQAKDLAAHRVPVGTQGSGKERDANNYKSYLELVRKRGIHLGPIEVHAFSLATAREREWDRTSERTCQECTVTKQHSEPLMLVSRDTRVRSVIQADSGHTKEGQLPSPRTTPPASQVLGDSGSHGSRGCARAGGGAQAEVQGGGRGIRECITYLKSRLIRIPEVSPV